MPEDERTSSTEEVVATEAAVVAEPAQPEPNPPEELEHLRKQNDAYRLELEAEKKAKSEADRAANRLAKERDMALGIQQAVQNAKLDLLARAQDGTLDESKGTLSQQVKLVDTEGAKHLQDMKFAVQAKDVVDEIFTLIRKAGYDPMAQTLPPEVSEIQNAYHEACEKRTSFDGVVAKAKALTAQKPQVKEPEKTEPAKEAPKKSLKVDTGTPSAPLANWRNMTTEEKMRLGLEQLKKNKR